MKIGDRRGYGLFAQVKGGYIVLNGYLASAILYNTPHQSLFLMTKSTSTRDRQVLKTYGQQSFTVENIHWDCDKHGFERANCTVFYLLAVLRDTIPGKGTPEEVDWIEGLVLEKVGTSKPKTFRRCGMFSMLQMQKMKMEAFAEGFKDEELEHKLDDDGIWRYTVTII